MRTWNTQDHDIIETVGWTGFFAGLLVGFVFCMVIYETQSQCLEDEVQMHSGECVPLDDIQEASIDLYIEANMQEARR